MPNTNPSPAADASFVSIGNGSTSFVGPDATKLYQAMTLRSALKLAKSGMQMTRSVSKAQTLILATRFTGKTYKRGAYDAAIADLTQWIEAMKAALPIDRA